MKKHVYRKGDMTNFKIYLETFKKGFMKPYLLVGSFVMWLFGRR